MKHFSDKVIVVTGAASGMGLAYAEEFAYLGARLAICDVDGPVLGVVAEELTKLIGAGNVYAERVDVSDRAQVFAFAQNVERALGPAHVIINNAGVGGSATPFYNMDLDHFERTLRINLNGVVYGTKAFLPQLLANGEGAVVNVSSVFGLVGPPNVTDYACSKFAVRGFTESLMAEFYKSPIQIHCVHPGGIDTAIARDNPDERFKDQMLITPPNEIVRHVIKCICRNQPRIVYGHQARRVYFGSRVLTPKWFVPQFWREARKVTDTTNYGNFNPALRDE